ncbi:hypothetical protein ACSBR2_015999 [Camellia fascicularis]
MFRLFLLLLLICKVDSNPPDDPVKCSSSPTKKCTITNSYGAFLDRALCRASDVAYLTTEQDLISLIALVIKNKRNIKVSTRFSHSLPKLVCPDGEDGLVISTKFLNRTSEIDHLSMTMSFETGAHGSSLWGVGSAVHDYVVGLDLKMAMPRSGPSAMVTPT